MIKAILPDKITAAHVPPEAAVVLVIHNKKLLSSLIKIVSTEFPLPSLKRVIQRDGQCLLLLCKMSDLSTRNNQPDNGGGITLDMREYLRELLKQSFQDMNVIAVEIPSCLPITEIQKRNSPWPVSFHPNKELELILTGENFTKSEKDSIFARIKQVLVDSVEASQQLMTQINSVLITNPISEVCFTRTNPNNFLEHAAMVAINKVADIQRINNITSNKIKDTLPCSNVNGSYRPSETPSKEYPVAKKLKLDTPAGDEMYLCTGYDVYLATEPCVMCAMALVHSRIKRVFFSRWRSDFGGVAEAGLQSIAALNHNFEVYQVSAED